MTDQTITTATVLSDYLDALSSGDLERVEAFFAPEVTWTIHGTLPLAGKYEGRAAVVKFLATAMGRLFAPGTQKFTFGQVLADGDTAILEWNVTGVGAATGLTYDNSYCGLFEIHDGRIHAVREYFDTDHVRHVLYGQPHHGAAAST